MPDYEAFVDFSSPQFQEDMKKFLEKWKSTANANKDLPLIIPDEWKMQFSRCLRSFGINPILEALEELNASKWYAEKNVIATIPRFLDPTRIDRFLMGRDRFNARKKADQEAYPAPTLWDYYLYEVHSAVTVSLLNGSAGHKAEYVKSLWPGDKAISLFDKICRWFWWWYHKDRREGRIKYWKGFPRYPILDDYRRFQVFDGYVRGEEKDSAYDTRTDAPKRDGTWNIKEDETFGF